jgi:LysR family transcriptional activator of glutamate synthase operon
MISNNDLHAFIITAQTGHLSKAAVKLGLSQPALSHAIHRLEKSLDTPLFLRRKTGLLLTKDGEHLLSEGERLINELTHLKNFFKMADTKQEIPLKMGIHPSVAIYILPKLMRKMNLNLQFDLGLSKEVTTRVYEGKLECAVAINPDPLNSLVITEIATDLFSIWVSKKLLHEDILYFDSRLPQTHILLRQLDKQGITFNKRIDLHNLELIAELVHEGCGVGLLPERVVKNKSPHQIRLFNKLIKPVKDRICFVYSSESRYKSHIIEIKKTIKEQF